MNRTGFARHGAASVRDAVAVRDASIAARALTARLARADARAAEAARVRFTPADVAGAALVRDRWGWWGVIRVNRTTVTVTDGPDTNHIRIDRILEVRPA